MLISDVCDEDVLDFLYELLTDLQEMVDTINIVDSKINFVPGKIISQNRTIVSFDEEDIPNIFRFRSRDQLNQVLMGLQFPATFKGKYGHVYKGEEVFLLGLFRLAHPIPSTHLSYKAIFGYANDKVKKMFNIFLNFICNEWDYLLFDMMSYWKPQLSLFASKIREKCIKLGCYFDTTFKVFGFIDNTMNAMCRPGGGPTRDGINAPRNDPIIQRSFYNGWKKCHGLKYQTVDIPNGMIFNAFGPVSCRHNDTFTLGESKIVEKIAKLFTPGEPNFYIYGDSAYPYDTHLRSRHPEENPSRRNSMENGVLSSCREVIEWDYGECMRLWKMCDYRKVLKMRCMPVDKMFICAMILRNLHICLNGCNASLYFECLPPNLSNYLSKGRKSTHETIA
jgi:hypothetical protein